MASRRSLAAQIVLPVLVLAAVAFVTVLVLAGRTTRQVADDYDRLALVAASSHVNAILDLATSELTVAHLGDNPVVVDAKQGAVQVAILSFWSRSGLDGVILDRSGDVLAATFPDPATRARFAGSPPPGFFVLENGGDRLRCVAEPFAPWGWTVITVGRGAPIAELRPAVATLGPGLALGLLALIGAVLFLLLRNLRTPVARMAADVESSHEVRPTGLAELDLIGGAVNSTMARLRGRTAELAEELERRQEVERALEGKEARVRLLLESTAEGIFGVDPSGTCTFCNPAALRLFGFATPEAVLGRNIHELVHHAHPDGSRYPGTECPIHRTCKTGEPARVTSDVFWRTDGTSFSVEYWTHPVREGGVLRGAVVGFVDITERTQLEQQLRQAQKMEAVGRLAGGIAHDFNNMLMAIVGHLSLARETVHAGTEAAEDLDQALAAADKASALTRQILAFSRSRSVVLAPVDLNEVVQGMGRVLARLVGEDVVAEYRLSPEPLVAMADRGQLEQVLLNLWTNARDAMPGGGRLVVSTRAVTLDAREAADLGLDEPGRYAALKVSDTGVGMDEPTRQRVFEPFFTTKEQGKGTGLGLSIVYGIAKQHRGQVGVVSAPGKGTTVTLHLPLADAQAARPQPVAAAKPGGGHETVLVAEDNDQVRELTRKVLEGAGYRVLAARDGEEALELHGKHGDEIALCLFDVVMPRLGGREALDALRKRRPGARAILMSGYAPDRPGEERDETPLLAKPFVPRELLRSVRDALDEGKAGAAGG